MNFISIITPTYNRANTISRTIESILLQEFTNWELIIVDDGGTDNTKQIIENSFRDDRISYYYIENRGVCAARNYGASKATGEWLIFLDSDDCFHLGFLKSISEIFSKTDYEINLFFSEIKLSGGNIKKKELNKFTAHSLLSGNFAIKKSFFDELGGYDPIVTYSENTELAIRILKSNRKFKIHETVSLIYNLENTIERRKRYYKKKKKSAIYILKKHPSFFKMELGLKIDYLKIISFCSYKTNDLYNFCKYGLLYLYYRIVINN